VTARDTWTCHKYESTNNVIRSYMEANYGGILIVGVRTLMRENVSHSRTASTTSVVPVLVSLGSARSNDTVVTLKSNQQMYHR
jgi:hypothetical protein